MGMLICFLVEEDLAGQRFRNRGRRPERYQLGSVVVVVALWMGHSAVLFVLIKRVKEIGVGGNQGVELGVV